jgi:hypothetical protein
MRLSHMQGHRYVGVCVWAGHPHWTKPHFEPLNVLISQTCC